MNKEDITTEIKNGIVYYRFKDEQGVDMVLTTSTETINLVGQEKALEEIIKEITRNYSNKIL